MPQNDTSPGPAPVPYTGGDQKPEPLPYGTGLDMPLEDPGALVMASYPPGNAVYESSWAHDLAAGTVDAPYYPGAVTPVNAAGDNDAGGRDDMAATVAEAVASAQGRYHEFQGDTYAQGSTIGDLMQFPPSPLDPGAGVGNTTPTGAFYDPGPRDPAAPDYGAPGEQGLAQ
jgi:hypothetical protein